MVQGEGLHKPEINFQRKTNANGNRDMCLKSVEMKYLDFCKDLCLFFFLGMNISVKAICDVKNHINVKCLHFSHCSSNNLPFGCAS